MSTEDLVRDCLQRRGYESPEGLDSLQVVELVLDLEEKVRVSIDEALIGTGVTLDELVHIVEEAAMKQRGGSSNGGS